MSAQGRSRARTAPKRERAERSPVTSPDTAATLRERLAALAPSVLEIRDDSAAHVGHAGAAGGAGHFSLLIVSEVFAGLAPARSGTSGCCAKSPTSCPTRSMRCRSRR